MTEDDSHEIDPEDFAAYESTAEIAKMGLNVYRALKRDGAQEPEALTVTAAFFAGMSIAAREVGNDGD